MNPLKARLPIPKELRINFAGMIFIGCAAFLFWSEQQLSTILSLRGMIFIGLGIVIANLFGWLIAKLHQIFAYRLQEKNNGEMNENTMQIIRFSGTALMLGQLLFVYYVTQKVFVGWPVGTVSI